MTARIEHDRAWCFRFQFPDKAPALFGTVLVRQHAPHHEVEQACWAEWDRVFPTDMPRPRLVALMPGTLVFAPEGYEA